MKKLFPPIHYLALLCALLLIPPSQSLFGDNQKDWNFMVYMVNNNNLNSFGIQNFRQMTRVGSTDSINILLQMDECGKRESKRFYVKKNNPEFIDHQGPSSSGTPKNLYDFVKWGVENYPSKYVLIDLWNHGSGIKDPHIWGRKIIDHRDEIYDFNPFTGHLELNRKLPYDGKWYKPENKERGIAFNDATEEYLTNQDLTTCLEKIRDEVLNGEKIDIIAMDACHMAMIEIASQVKTTAKLMVASEEVEPGGGYNYYTLLKPFTRQTFSPSEFASHIVNAYESEYVGTLGDYTQSAVDLSYTSEVEEKLTIVSNLLIELIEASSRNARKAIRSIRLSNRFTTEFLDTDYIDLGHFLKSLIDTAMTVKNGTDKWFSSWLSEETDSKNNKVLWDGISDSAYDCLQSIEKMVTANTYGMNFSQTCGLSIYFPVRRIDSSYKKTVFAQSTTWLDFLKKYLNTKNASVTQEEQQAVA